MLRLAFCVLGIYTCFLSWGVLQERVTSTVYVSGKKQSKFTHFVYLNLVQSVIAAIVAYICLLARGRRLQVHSRQLLSSYARVAFLSTIASPFGYESLRHVDYPTMILAKSCKLLPVIAMSWLLYRKVHAWYKYVSVLMVTAGVALFTLGHPVSEKDASKVSSLYGLLLLTINLTIDGVTNSSQDYMFSQYSITSFDLMFFMNAFSAAFMVVYLTVITPFMNSDGVSDMAKALAFQSTFTNSFQDVLTFGFAGALGQVFIFYTLENFGSLILVTINVVRKMLSLLLSVFWFNHKLVPSQWIGVVTVFSGIILEAEMTRQAKLTSAPAVKSSGRRASLRSANLQNKKTK